MLPWKFHRMQLQQVGQRLKARGHSQGPTSSAIARPGTFMPSWRMVRVPFTSLLLAFGYLCAPAHANTYETISGGVLHDEVTPCTSPLQRTFQVTNNFAVTDVNLGLNITHSFRGDVRVTLIHPDGTSVQVITEAFEFNENYDVLLDSDSANALNDGDNDDQAVPLYDRTASPANSLDAFDGKSPVGTWTLDLCDTDAGSHGVFHAAELIFNDATPAPSSTVGNGQADVGEVGVFSRATSDADGGVTTLPNYFIVDGEELGPCFCSNKDLALPDGDKTEFKVADLTTITNADFGDGSIVSGDILDKVRRTIAAFNNGYTPAEVQNTVWSFSDNYGGGDPDLISDVNNGTNSPVTVTFLEAPVTGGVQSVQNFTCAD